MGHVAPVLLFHASKVPDQGRFRAPSAHISHLQRLARSRTALRPKLIFAETKGSDLLSLKWPSPPRNVLLLKKDDAPTATEALVEFAE